MNLEQFLEQIQKVLLPQAVEVGASVVMINGIQGLVIGVIAVILSFGLYKAAKRCWNKLFTEDEDLYGFGVIFAAFACLGSGLIAAFNILNVWNWVALFNPKLALAHELYSAVLRLAK